MSTSVDGAAGNESPVSAADPESPASAADPGFDRSGAHRYAEQWARAAARHGFVATSTGENQRLLLAHTVRLAQAVLAEPFAAEAGHDIGRALVEAHLTEPGVLDWSVRALGEQFRPLVLPTRTEPETARRIAVLQGALSAGFARALRERTLGQQERIAQAAWEARDRVERALRDSEARFRAVFVDAAIGIGIADVDGQIVDVNRAFAELLGYTVDELRKINVSALFHPDDAAGMWELYQDLVEGKQDAVRVQKRYYRKDGSVVWTDLAVSLIRHDDGRPRYTVAMVEDITERHEFQQRLRHQATHDPLTGLPNRTLFLDRLGEVFATGGPDDRVGICFLDLDGFKAVNDSLGHDLGDNLLVTVARRLADCVAGQGHLVARMGGDEFVILIDQGAGCRAVKAVAAEALAAVAEPVQVGEHRLSVSASIGVVSGPLATTSVAELMKAADVTLYWAKAEGRNRWVSYDPARRSRERTRSALIAGMAAALQRDEFLIDYQPIVTLADGTICAVEALVRWQHPELGLLGPDEFIGLAEETGLIVELGRWVLARACEAASRWHREFPDARLVVSVNLAARQARDPAVVGTVSEVLRQTDLPADLLQLELTESAVMATAGEPLPALRKLAALGVRLAIDDFGTGYSNLAYLRRLPIHNLKLAGPFVEGIRSSDRQGLVDGRIVDALVRLAHALGLTVTAEAVETVGQADQLRALGCDAAQGRHFAAPAPEGEITRWLAARAERRREGVR
ncbi:putative bifunctional diguanylate cyclase/phosphodiesterase [Plantactinospora endophytica]|uniref:GGDEF domain-containing protein n=1 Tax=Plantactinospora endophytica TaxID=673535 RepID=A0ABQ4DVW9_9ACTN|nr:EAL domain-containing protein [Plantactinospora endophytica]GIG86595.1 GGDEF domain-containing protein [Plantactinospora endophytica]